MSPAVVASILVGAAFLLAGGAKIAAGPGWQAQARGLGVPTRAVSFLPGLEIGIGALLCAQLARPAPALIAVAMLSVFTGLLSLRLAQGRHPPCACFGSWSAKPISWRHVARNVALIALAVIALAA